MLQDIEKLLKPRPRKYRNIVKHLTRFIEIKNITDPELTESELFDDLTQGRGSSRFLGIYSQRGIEFSLEKFGIFEELKKLGLPGGSIKLDMSNAYKHRLQVEHAINDNSHLSGEIVMRRGFLNISRIDTDRTEPMEFLIIEWFMLQNPIKQFSKRRPQLPGQDHPGLGISALIYEILYWVGRRMKADGVVLVPNYLHTGLFYSRQFLFLDPKKQGLIFACNRLVQRKYKLDQLTWASAEGQLIDLDNAKPIIWEPTPMSIPISPRLKDYFYSRQYNEITKNIKDSANLQIVRGYKKQYDPEWKAI